ncbi:MAG TPA: methyltransferase [Micromonosporaceae bacterium]|nr:methyltransferase [Micromonosporaceae bacterium]
MARRRLTGIFSGSWLAQACYASVKLGLPDLLAAGPRTADELAATTGANPHALLRLLRALATAGVYRADGPRSFGLTPVSELLRTGAPGAGHLLALMQGEEMFRSFAEIMHTVRTGQPAFEKVHGQSFYAYLDDHPVTATTFNESMGGQPVPAALSTCDLSGVRSLVDVGGGNGTLLAAVLAGHPEIRGTLLERPDALRAARTRLAAAGLADRVDFVEGSFFDGVPAGGDRYVLARVLHNWTDPRALEILGNIRRAMAPGGRLIVLEDFTDTAPGLVDLLMLVVLEGFERSEAEYHELLRSAGFEILGSRPGVVEAGPE